jgi:hypothetical protein
MDINYCIDYLELNANSYKLDQSNPPHKITYWDNANPDKQPTDAELKTAWVKAKVKMDVVEEIERLESTVTPRRIREMTTDDGAKWVDDVEKLIVVERGKL